MIRTKSFLADAQGAFVQQPSLLKLALGKHTSNKHNYPENMEVRRKLTLNSATPLLRLATEVGFSGSRVLPQIVTTA